MAFQKEGYNFLQIVLKSKKIILTFNIIVKRICDKLPEESGPPEWLKRRVHGLRRPLHHSSREPVLDD
jgi:hypothetical protein